MKCLKKLILTYVHGNFHAGTRNQEQEDILLLWPYHGDELVGSLHSGCDPTQIHMTLVCGEFSCRMWNPMSDRIYILEKIRLHGFEPEICLWLFFPQLHKPCLERKNCSAVIHGSIDVLVIRLCQVRVQTCTWWVYLVLHTICDEHQRKIVLCNLLRCK